MQFSLNRQLQRLSFVAVILALRSVARSARLEQIPLETGDHTQEEHALLNEHIVAYRIDGPLFFGAAHRLLLELPDLRRQRRLRDEQLFRRPAEAARVGHTDEIPQLAQFHGVSISGRVMVT